MKKFFLVSSLTLSSFFISASFLDNPIIGDGVLKSEKRNVSSFNKISISGGLNISIVCQKQQSINIEGDTNIISLIKTYVEKNVLNITTNQRYKENQPLKIEINNPDINNIQVKGTSILSVIQIKNQAMNIVIDGNTNINAKGQSKKLFLDLSGSGYIDTKNLKTEETKVDLKGFSMVDVFATKSLDATISGFGKINYYGEPKNVKKNITGTGYIIEGKNKV
ncbi:MAG: DUF2807 domain-containing protein [Candidatus Sericytochromatia bacterium]